MVEHNAPKSTYRFKRFLQRKPHFRYLIMGVVGLMVFTLALQWAWNMVVPALFGLTGITFWQALGLMVLLRLTAGIMGLTRRRPRHVGSAHTGPGRPRRGPYNHTFMACDSHRVI